MQQSDVSVVAIHVPGIPEPLRLSIPVSPILPIWAHVWPAGVGLAHHLWGREDLKGKRVLEIGPGVGSTSAILGRMGAAVTLVDISPNCLKVAAYNMHANSGVDPWTICADITKPNEELGWELERGFDLIVGADILYERPTIPHVLKIIEHGERAIVAGTMREEFALFTFEAKIGGRALGIHRYLLDLRDPMEGTLDPIYVVTLV